jgi:hypothetical protein
VLLSLIAVSNVIPSSVVFALEPSNSTTKEESLREELLDCFIYLAGLIGEDLRAATTSSPSTLRSAQRALKRADKIRRRAYTEIERCKTLADSTSGTPCIPDDIVCATLATQR